MWKSGIHWLMEEGVECVVEVVKEKEVHRGMVVVAQSKENCDMQCASVFSAVVQRKTGSAHQDQPESAVML